MRRRWLAAAPTGRVDRRYFLLALSPRYMIISGSEGEDAAGIQFSGTMLHSLSRINVNTLLPEGVARHCSRADTMHEIRPVSLSSATLTPPRSHPCQTFAAPRGQHHAQPTTASMLPRRRRPVWKPGASEGARTSGRASQASVVTVAIIALRAILILPISRSPDTAGYSTAAGTELYGSAISARRFTRHAGVAISTLGMHRLISASNRLSASSTFRYTARNPKYTGCDGFLDRG